MKHNQSRDSDPRQMGDNQGTDSHPQQAESTPSNPPILDPTANAPSAKLSCPAGPHDVSRASSVLSVIENLTLLAKEISRDREVHVYSKDVLLNAHIVGQGFVENSVEADEDEKACPDPAEPPLFVGGDSGGVLVRGDAECVDPGVEEEEDLVQNEDDETSPGLVIKWLNRLGDQIKALHRTPTAGQPTPCPYLAIEPKPYQYTGLARIEHCCRSALKAILVGDPPGLGKTLMAMMAIVKAISTAKRFSIVVVPSSCLDQWKSEFVKFFLPDTVQVFVLRDPNTSPLELLKYDVILVSYSFVMSQYRKLCKYVNAVAESENDGRGGHLERPSLSIFSEIFCVQEGVKCPYLVLDEVTSVKNPNAITFAAIQELRSMADMCIMLTGSPIDNTWMDVFAYLQFVLGHDIRSRQMMLLLFASRSVTGKLRPPAAKKLLRLVQLLNSFIIRRPEDTTALPALHEQTVTFSLASDDEASSNYHFVKYKTIVNMKSNNAGYGGEELSPWKQLTWAVQFTMHPAMTRIMHLVRNPLAQGNDEASADVLHESKDIQNWITWREELKKDDQWKSSRIMALIDVFNEQRDIDPACSVLIFDESVYFLDIVQIAFENMYDPVDCLRFDGRETPEKRTAILQTFEKAAGAQVLLVSRAAGGVGLNITAANIVILCSPWWKKEWEFQAIKRAHRPGQMREVVAIRLKADNCKVEAYKALVRDKKNKNNARIYDHITRMDGIVPEVWDDLD